MAMGDKQDVGLNRRAFLKVAPLAISPFVAFLSPLLGMESSADTALKCTAPLSILGNDYQIKQIENGHEMLFQASVKGSNEVTSHVRVYLRSVEAVVPKQYSFQLSQQWFRPGEVVPAGQGNYSVNLSLTPGDPVGDGVHLQTSLT